MRRLLQVTLLLLLPAGCASQPPPSTSPPPPAAEDEELSPIVRATRALERGDVARARAEIELHLEDEPDDAQARYVYARALATQGELRGARAQVNRAIQGSPRNALMWSLRADVEEQLGEHQEALVAYAQVHELVDDSLDPLLGMSRCLLLLGRPDQALLSLEEARNRPAKDAWTEYLRFVALRRLARSDDAEGAARAFLEQVDTSKEPAHRERAVEVRSWLAARGDPISPDARQALVDAVRAGLRLRLPGADAPEDEVLSKAPARVMAFDERPVFVTVSPTDGGPALRGRGRGRSLASALKGALQTIQEHSGYTAVAVRDAAVRIDVARSLEGVAVRDGTDARGGAALEADPAVVPGRHGVAVRVDGQELVTLPADVLAEGLDGLEPMLRAAAVRGGLGPEAWRAGARTTFRFETDGWLSPSPGTATLSLAGSEPLPLPGGSASEVRAAVRDAARWLTTLLAPAGEGAVALAPSHDAARGLAAPGEAAVDVEARAALALARAHAASGDPVLLVAAEHLLARVLARLQPDAAGTDDGARLLAAPWALRALRAVLALEPEDRRAALAGAEAGLVARAREARGLQRPAALVALLEPAEPTGAPPLQDGLPQDDPLVVEARALLAARGDAAAWADVLAWARAEAALTKAAPDPLRASPVALDRARRLAALARVARLAAARGDAAAPALRTAVGVAAADLLALALAPRHRALLRAAERATGAFRARAASMALDPRDTAEAVLGLLAALEVLSGS